LSKTLFTQPFPSISSNEHITPHNRNAYSQPCNTPVTRTPSASFSIARPTPRRRSSAASRPVVDESVREDEETREDDEQMVEDILMQSSPMSCTASPSATSFPHHFPAASNPVSCYPIPSQSQSPTLMETSPNSSTFPFNDPFYLAQLRAANSVPQSAFANAGRPAPHSPFMIKHRPANQPQRECHGQHPPLHIDTHPLPLATSSDGQ
jgi:hypothetical protein